MVLKKLVFVLRGIKVNGLRWDTLAVIDWEALAKNREGYTRGKVLLTIASECSTGRRGCTVKASAWTSLAS